MSSPHLSPFSLTRTFVFRRYFTLRSQVAAAVRVDPASEAAHQARKCRKKEAKNERLRNFYGWCEGCAAYGSIF
ncbi:hypothetical protein [Hymenobacter elongatus]|uniref:Uncharacterized protein n=1 Tax=Hymenobacter elongatus TaxID=877208 RepID=A0A4Z0PKQ7_9BACT|nr:hypothetical protein [Hymenobacter elongatus]TGE15792.1 hypothetical protein E5J99_11370 [Hymenobacter elongatus]